MGSDELAALEDRICALDRMVNDLAAAPPAVDAAAQGRHLMLLSRSLESLRRSHGLLVRHRWSNRTGGQGT